MDREKLKQAFQETAITFVVLFAVSFCGWVSGWTVLPDLNAGLAALRAAVLAGATGAAKGIVWYLTGTKVAR